MKGTKENPYTMHFLVAELAKDGGEGIYYKKVYASIEKVKHLNRTIVVIKGRRYTLTGKRQLKGGIPVYTTKEKKDFLVSKVVFDEIYDIFEKPFGSYSKFKDVTTIKKGYKECLGGGWSSKINLYEYKGKFYANVECSTYMHGEYWKQAGLDKFTKLK